jgi:hypothetical protein
MVSEVKRLEVISKEAAAKAEAQKEHQQVL